MPEIDRLLGNMVMTDVEFRSVEGTSQEIYSLFPIISTLSIISTLFKKWEKFLL